MHLADRPLNRFWDTLHCRYSGETIWPIWPFTSYVVLQTYAWIWIVVTMYGSGSYSATVLCGQSTTWKDGASPFTQSLLSIPRKNLALLGILCRISLAEHFLWLNKICSTPANVECVLWGLHSPCSKYNDCTYLRPICDIQKEIAYLKDIISDTAHTNR